MKDGRADVVVVGGGLIGCVVAHALAADGHGVRLLERDAEPGQRASSAAAGMLAPQMEGARHGVGAMEPDARCAMLVLALESRARYPAFVRTLEEEGARSVPYRDEGTVVVALDDAERRHLERAAERQRARGLAAELLDGGAARRLEPLLGPDVVAALHLPDDHAVDNVALMKAAVAAALARGVAIETGTAVESIAIDGDRVGGVWAGERRFPAAAVVVAAGAWSGRLEGLPRRLPVRPVRGQIGHVYPPSFPRRTIAGPGAYCVPRDDGRVVVGATMEEAGFDDGVSGAAVRGLVEAAARFLPVLGEVPELDAWSGLRPATPDGLPILGADPDVAGLHYATGHFRNGILLAPVTAAAIAALVGRREPPVELGSFRPDRFEIEPAPRRSTTSY